MTGEANAVRMAASGIRVMPDASARPVLNDVPILDDAAIDIRAGEVHALVGPNGAGKSTLFGVLAGDVTHVAGTVVLDGMDLRRHPARAVARLRGVLLQQNAVSFPFSVVEVVRMGRAPWARTTEEANDDERVAEAMRATEIEPAMAMAHLRLALIARRRGEREQAKDELVRAIDTLKTEPAERLALHAGGLGRDALVRLARAELAAIEAGR